MQRRQFLQLSAIGGTVILVTGISCNQQRPVSYDILGKPEALAQICDLKTLREIGRTYQDQTASEKDADKLATLLLTDTSGNTASSAADQSFIQDLISKKIEHDFQTGNTVIVKGWILSRHRSPTVCIPFLNNP